MIPFTIRELKNATRNGNIAARAIQGGNHQLLLLFYAVECGLKAVLLAREGKSVIDQTFAGGLAHNINAILLRLKVSKEYFLPANISICDIRGNNGEDIKRNFSCGELNQVWRYGASIDVNVTRQLEERLLYIMSWIQKEF